MTSVIQTDELLSLMNLFRQFAPGDMAQKYMDGFSKIRPWVFPGNLLLGMSDFLSSSDYTRPTIRDPECWNRLFTDIKTRFKRVKNQLANRTALSLELKEAIRYADQYCDFLEKSLKEGRTELFHVLERWGVNTLRLLSLMIQDNLFIAGAGPIGLITAYFLKTSIPSLKIVVYEKRPDYVRDYHVLLTEDSFDSLPHEIQAAVWGTGKYGCYVLPPPIDAKGYCYINPPHNTEVPARFYSGWYPDMFFDVHPRTGKRTIKKLMSIPIRVFESKMYELIRRRFPDVTFIRPRSGDPSDRIQIRNSNSDDVNGFNRMEFLTQDGQLIAKNVFNNNFMYNYYIDEKQICAGNPSGK